MIKRINELIKESIRVKEKLLETQSFEIDRAAKLIISCLKRGGKVIVFGNGGSAADSQHFAAELVGRFKKERKPLPAIALTTNTSILTAIANDYNYEDVFQKQIEALGDKRDVAIGISTSGKARNVIKGIITAKKMKMKTICLTGERGTDLARLVDVSIIVPSADTARIQEAHITVEHILCELIEDTLFKDK